MGRKPDKIFFAMAENLEEGPLKEQLHKKGIEHGLVCVKVYYDAKSTPSPARKVKEVLKKEGVEIKLPELTPTGSSKCPCGSNELSQGERIVHAESCDKCGKIIYGKKIEGAKQPR